MPKIKRPVLHAVLHPTVAVAVSRKRDREEEPTFEDDDHYEWNTDDETDDESDYSVYSDDDEDAAVFE